MSRGRILFLFCSILLIGSLMLGGIGRPAWALEDDGEDSLYQYIGVFTEVLKLVRTVYVEELDLRPLMAGALDGSADALDPFSVFVPSSRVADFRRAREVGRARSGMMVLRERGVAFVAALDEGSPAHRAGIRREDVISELEGLSTRDMPMWQIHEILTRAEGTSIELEVVRQGEALPMQFELASFAPPQPTLRDVEEYAVLRIPSVERDTASQVAELLGGVGDRPLLLDLRGAADRTPELGFELAELFVGGALGTLRKREETLATFESDRAPVLAAGELSLLTDRGTMGAAEVLTSVLRAKQRARSVGTRTFGFAGRSKQIVLSSGDLLEVTDAFYAPIEGDKLSEALEPDLPIARRFFRVRPSDDVELEEDGEAEIPADAEDDAGDDAAARDNEVLLEALRLLREAPAEAA